MADYTWKLVLVFNWKVFVLDQTWLYHKSKAQNFIFHEEGLFKSKTSTKKESTALQKVGTLFSNMLKTHLSKSTRKDMKPKYFLLLKITKNNQRFKHLKNNYKNIKSIRHLKKCFLFMHTLRAESFQGKSNSNMRNHKCYRHIKPKNLHHSCLLLLLLQGGEVLFHSCGC